MRSKKTATIEIRDYSLAELRRLAPLVWPDATPVPEVGCWSKAKSWLHENNISLSELHDVVLEAEGNRAWAIYSARRDGWWPEDEQEQEGR